MAEKLRKNSFTLDDFLEQMQQLKKMGPLGGLMEMIPGFGGMAKEAQAAVDRGELKRAEAIIQSMTPASGATPTCSTPRAAGASPAARARPCRRSTG